MAGPVGSIFSMKTFWSPETILFKDWEKIVSNMHIHHTAIRPFMRGNDPEPNKKYRPWLEEHIGEQGVTWNWQTHGVDGNSLAIDFATEEHATLFELTWL